MTDNDIIKALECCSKPVGEDCKECPLTAQDCLKVDIEKLALDLINRQKAEIEEQDQAIVNALKRMGQIRAEAITEFAERLKKYYNRLDNSQGNLISFHIDQIAKEMKGEQ